MLDTNSLLLKKDNIAPPIPNHWDYLESLKKVTKNVKKMRELSKDLFEELWIAREALSMSYSQRASWKLHGTNVPSKHVGLSPWEMYCREIGVSRQTINRWLKIYYEKKKKFITGNAIQQTIADEYVDSVKNVMDITQDFSDGKADVALSGLNELNIEGNVFFNSFQHKQQNKYISDVARTIKKCVDEGNVKSAVMMLENRQMHKPWFKDLYEGTLCIIDGNLKLQEGEKSGKGVCVVHFGSREEEFIEEFSKHGTIFKKICDKQEVEEEAVEMI